MRTWFDRTIEGGLIVLGCYAVYEAGRILIELNSIVNG